MTRRWLLLTLLNMLFLSAVSHAQLWSGILKPTYGTGACTVAASGQPASCGIDWTAVGIPGGVPSATWTQSGSTIASPGGSVDATATIQAALNACGSNHYVLLAAGTFRINTVLNVHSNCVLRGSGTQSTILNSFKTTGPVVQIGSGSPSAANSTGISSGATAGSQSITVASASGISVGSYLMITELNNPAYVSITGDQGSCSWCDGSMWSGTRTRGQIVEVTSVNGSVIGISPGLYTNYSSTPFATRFTASAKYAGVESLQIYANGTSNSGNSDASASDVTMNQCAYCWVEGIEDNYSDGNHVQANASYRVEIRDSYFVNAFNHVSGQTDANVNLILKTSASLIENNIMERLHNSVMVEWGAAGNVIAYNYSTGAFDTTATNVAMMDFDLNHGPQPQFNLVEGNVVSRMEDDNIWGSVSHNTYFRNWAWGTTNICSPEVATRSNFNCSSGKWANQATRAFEMPQVASPGTGAWYDNLIGNVAGSSALAALGAEDHSGTDGCTACNVSPATRGYQTGYDFTFGYSGSGDATGACSSRAACTSYIGTLLHGNYANATGTVEVWAGAITHTLPASFYKSSKPTWWGSAIPWPAIGPDVTGGTGPGGHASLTASNPAQACYNSTSKTADGSLAFDPSTCYSGSGKSTVLPPTVNSCSICTGSSCSSTACTVQP